MADRSQRPSTPVVVGCLVLLAVIYGGFALSGEGGRSGSPVVSGAMAVIVVALLGWFLLRRRRSA